MYILIIAAKNIKQAGAITKRRKKDWYPYVVEEEVIGDFLYNNRSVFENYEYYYKFDPYGETFIEAVEVIKIKQFAESVIKFLENNDLDENKIIDSYKISFLKIKKFSQKLCEVCEFAIENNLGLVGYGD